MRHDRKLALLFLLLAGSALAKPVISERLLPNGKSAGTAQRAAAVHFMVVFEPDVSAADAERTLLNAGVLRVEHPDLLPGHYLVSGSLEALFRLAEVDGPAYIYPASKALVERHPVMNCSGPLTEMTIAAPYTALVGQGWDGSGRRSATLTYSLEQGSHLLPDDVVIAAVERALGAWAATVALQYSRTDDPKARRNINIRFAAGSHDDPFPFDGRGRVLAHAFYPAGVNPEPIAGDLHLDADESWSDGGATDVYSVLLHELGHSLGLGHSDHPEAVMYPYYRASAGLHEEDRAAIRMLYETTEENPAVPAPAPEPAPAPAPSAPPSDLRIETASDRVALSGFLSLSGAVAGGTGAVRVTYSIGAVAGVAAGGRSWSISKVPVPVGSSQVRIDAEDEAGARATLVVQVTRAELSPAAGQPDKARPAVKVTSPGVNTYLTGRDVITIQGTVSDKSAIQSVTCSRGGALVAATGGERWSCDVPLLIGDNRISIVATDAAGNQSLPKQILITRR